MIENLWSNWYVIPLTKREFLNQRYYYYYFVDANDGGGGIETQ